MRIGRRFAFIALVVVALVVAGCNGGAPKEMGIAPKFLSANVDGMTIRAKTAEPSIPAYGRFMYAIQMPLIAGITEKPIDDSYSDTILGSKVNVVRTKEADGSIRFEATGDSIAAEVVCAADGKSFSYRQVLNSSISGVPIDYFTYTLGNDISYNETTESWEGIINIYVLMDHSNNPAYHATEEGIPYSMSNFQAYYHSDDAVTGVCIYTGKGGGDLVETSPVITSVQSLDDADKIIAFWNKIEGSTNSGGPKQLVYYNGSYNFFPYQIVSDQEIIAKAKELSPNWDLTGKI